MGEEGGAGKGLSRDHISISAHEASSFQVSREKERVTESERVTAASVFHKKIHFCHIFCKKLKSLEQIGLKLGVCKHHWSKDFWPRVYEK